MSSNRKYKSRSCQDLYETFSSMFKQEGNCYNTIVDSLNENYEHHQIGTNIPKLIVMGVLKDVTVDFYKKKIKIKSEKEFLNGRN